MRFREVWNDEPLFRIGKLSHTYEAPGNIRIFGYTDPDVPVRGQTPIPNHLRDPLDMQGIARVNLQTVQIQSDIVVNPHNLIDDFELGDCDRRLIRSDLLTQQEVIHREVGRYNLHRPESTEDLVDELRKLTMAFASQSLTFTVDDTDQIFRHLTGRDPVHPVASTGLPEGFLRSAHMYRPAFEALSQPRYRAMCQRVAASSGSARSFQTTMSQLAYTARSARSYEDMRTSLMRFMTHDDFDDVMADAVARDRDTGPIFSGTVTGRTSSVGPDGSTFPRTSRTPIPAPQIQKGVVIPTRHKGRRPLNLDEGE